VIAIANALRFREAEIEASTDWLTGLPTRRAFMSRLGRLKEELPPTALVSALMIDLDKFKWVNDTYGHSVGDAVLSAITSICKTPAGQRTVQPLRREEILAVLPYADGGPAMGDVNASDRGSPFPVPKNPEIQLTVSIAYKQTLRRDYSAGRLAD
jgi:diguanylate cyclase (GGDEF)-like protein